MYKQFYRFVFHDLQNYSYLLRNNKLYTDYKRFIQSMLCLPEIEVKSKNCISQYANDILFCSLKILLKTALHL